MTADNPHPNLEHDPEPGAGPRRGKTTIAHDVLLTIARLSALQTAGVSRTSPLPAGRDWLFKRGVEDGVSIEVRGQAVAVDLYLVMEPGQNLRQVSHAVQAAVRRAVEEMVGMDVLAVNVHVEDIADSESEAQ